MSKRNPNLAAPMVMRGFEAYRSPVSGELIQSRKEKERDQLKHDCVDARDTRNGGKRQRAEVDQ